MNKMFDNPEKSRVVIIGTGAMACLFGSKIAPYVNKLTLIGTWAEGVKALQKDGIHFIEGGVETKTPVQSFQNPEKLKSDIVLVLVKSYQTPRAAKWAAKILGSNGLAVTLQNGLGNIEQLRSVLGSKRTALGVSMESSTLLGPGKAYHGGKGLTVLTSSPDTQERLKRLNSLFLSAGFETRLTSDSRSLLWGKLVINTAINALTAILGVKNGALADQPEGRELMAAVAKETAEVAKSLGITLPYPDPVNKAIEVAQNTAANRSSMLQDILRGTPTEIEAINGEVVKIAHKIGMQAPVNEMLLRLVRMMSSI